MIDLNGSQTQQEIAPWNRTAVQWDEVSDKQYEAVQSRRLADLTPLFTAYFQNQSDDNKEMLTKWVMNALTAAAKKKYRNVYGSYKGDKQAETKAAQKTLSVVNKLESSKPYESPEHLASTFGTICKRFRSDAMRDIKPKSNELRTVPLEAVCPTTGKLVMIDQIRQKRENLFIMPASDSKMAAEEAEAREKAAKRNLVHVPAGKPRDYLTKENNLFIGFLSPTDSELFYACQVSNWDRAETAKHLGIPLSTLNRRINRIGDDFQDMRQVLLAFRLPMRNREPIEHRDDLADRFVAFVSRLRTYKESQFPKTFAEAHAYCAHEHPPTTDSLLYEPHEVVSHLVRIWKKAQTTQ